MKRYFYSARLSSFGATAFPFIDNICGFEGIVSPEQLTRNDGMLCLWGGEDISPSIYGERCGPSTYAGDVPSIRDEAEMALFNRAVEMGIPILGICRGAQLACAMVGGRLVQDVRGHAGRDHDVRIIGTNEVYTTSSVHHQQLFPWNVSHQLIAYAVGVGRDHSDQYGKPVEFPEVAYREDGALMEPEIVFFPQANCLAIQGHPEFMQYDDAFVKYVNRLIERTFCNAPVSA